MRQNRIRVLLVEDDGATRALLRARLCHVSGIEVCSEEGRNGVEGLRLIRELNPHLVLLDLVMPQMSGLALLSELKQDPPACRPRVVVISKVNSEPVVERVFALGADFYLQKPVNLSELAELIPALFGPNPSTQVDGRGQAGEILRELGASPEVQGYRWAALAAEALANQEGMLLKEAYYPAIHLSGASYNSIDKNIRDMIRGLHRVNKTEYRAFLGEAAARCPSCGAFLKRLAQEVRRRTGRVT